MTEKKRQFLRNCKVGNLRNLTMTQYIQEVCEDEDQKEQKSISEKLLGMIKGMNFELANLQEDILMRNPRYIRDEFLS